MNSIEEQLLPSVVESVPRVSDPKSQDTFHLSMVVTLAAGHAAHDTYFSYLPTILPLLIKNLALSTTQAGWLSAVAQFPNLLQPVIGHLADRKNLKLLIIVAPALTGCLITLVGIAPSFGVAALLMLLAGFSSAGFHALAPPLTGAQAGRRVGRGMGFLMVGGELGYGLGPIVVVVTIGFLTLKGLPWLMTLGLLASLILYVRLKDVSTVRSIHAEAGLPVRQALLQMRGLMLPILAISFITSFLYANVTTYLPTFMASEGVAFALAGGSLAVVELSATVGVLLMGLFSDRLGQRTMVLGGTLLSIGFSMGFLLVKGWPQALMLMGIGFSAFVANPAFLSMVQVHFAQNRSLANGLYMSCSFILRSVAVVLVGVLADRFGLRSVFIGSTWLALLAVPLIFILPKR
jgi:MFS transporter, FSR family, fosmidomycin resistance protein